MYRQSNGKDIWHSNAGCSLWPLLNFEEKEAPEGGRMCDQCAEIELMVRRDRVTRSRFWESTTREREDRVK